MFLLSKEIQGLAELPPLGKLLKQLPSERRGISSLLLLIGICECEGVLCARKFSFPVFQLLIEL